MSHTDPGIRKEYRKKYYEEHKEEEKANARIYRSENREKFRAYGRKSYWKRRKEISIQVRERRKKLRAEAFQLLGGCCFICKRNDKELVIHEKEGNPHRPDVHYLVLKNPEKFALLCRSGCHFVVHFIMKYLGMSWSELEVRLPLKENSNAC